MKIISILNSLWFLNALVIETECGHKHVRPTILVKQNIGDNFICWCERDKQEEEKTK